LIFFTTIESEESICGYIIANFAIESEESICGYIIANSGPTLGASAPIDRICYILSNMRSDNRSRM